MVIDFTTFYDFPRMVDRLMEEMGRTTSYGRRGGYPPLFVSEDDKAVSVRAELPGVPMEDIELTLTDKSLVIRGRRAAEKGRYVRQERPSGDFQRIVTLGVPVARDAVRATLADGVLTVTLPKAEDERPRTITINEA